MCFFSGAILALFAAHAAIANEIKVGDEPYPGMRLTRFLGKGAFGQVWEATTGSEKVAVKFMLARANVSPAEEVKGYLLVKTLNHPNLVRYHQVWIWNGYVAAAMELADGTLRELAEIYREDYNVPIPPKDTCFFLGPVAQALDFLNLERHQLADRSVMIQHCDAKPDNMFLFGDTVKLGDFGLASPMNTRSKLHRVAGTPDYAAPEVFQGTLTQWTDQYALAVSYFLLRTGKLPFPSMKELVRGHVRQPPDLSAVSLRERPILERALSPTPPDRWPSCQALIAALDAIVE